MSARPAPASRLDRRTTDGGISFALYAGAMRLLGLIVDPVNRVVGAKRMAYVFILPNMALFAVFSMAPIVINVAYSFSSGAEIFPQSRSFVGQDNYSTLLSCQDYTDPNTCAADLFWRGVRNTSTYVTAEVGILMVLSLVTALALNERIRGRGFFRSVFFYPVLLSPVVVALIWKWVLQREGILNAVLEGVGLPSVNWLVEPMWSRFWVVTVSVWATMGFYTLILLAGLQGINPQLYEAARVDGASRWQRFRDITFPLLRPSLLVAFMLAFIRSVQAFDIPFVLTGGGPGSRNLFILQYIYDVGFSTSVRNFGLAATASVLLAIILVVFSYLQLRVDRKIASGS